MSIAKPCNTTLKYHQDQLSILIESLENLKENPNRKKLADMTHHSTQDNCDDYKTHVGMNSRIPINIRFKGKGRRLSRVCVKYLIYMACGQVSEY